MRIKYILPVILLSACISSVNAVNNVFEHGLEGRLSTDELTRKYVTPLRLIPLSDKESGGVSNPEALLQPFDGQLAVNSGDVCVLTTRDGKKAAILIDFGKELSGGVEIAAPIRSDQKALKVRVRMGESVSEAMSDIASPLTTATNQHSLRDFTVEIPWLGTLEIGNSGFRFVRIDLVEPDAVLPLKAVRGVLRYRDIPYKGSFKCSNPRLDSIWATAAYTVHLNMQNYLWDGVKRDRLVWVGDMHPEVMTIANVFGDFGVVKKSLDFARVTSPLPGWMNGIAAYSMWWILIHHDLYMHTGDMEYLREQTSYMNRLFEVLAAGMDGDRENLQGGQRLLDWPTSENPDVIHTGYQALMVMAMEAGVQIGNWTGEKDMVKLCEDALKKLRRHIPSSHNNKQAAAMLVLSELSKDPKSDGAVICDGGADGFSTFFGYYMLEALAKAGFYSDAQKIVSDYWGAMLDLGATTFWEDLNYTDALKASRIDEPVTEGEFDIHADTGSYCYVGHRHSYCHGWASGAAPWLTRYVLGIRPAEPGYSTLVVEPHLGDLDWAEGTVPTPKGVVTVRHERDSGGKVHTTIDVPEGVRVINASEED